MINSISHILGIVLLALPLAGCSGGTKKADISEIEGCDSIPKSVKALVRAVADNDTVRFAEMVNYPLSRPYPLHDIEDEVQMRQYYGVMVDDSLRNVIVSSRPDDWEEYGWRGWTIGRGDYLWVDEDLYDVSYVSARERAMLDSLTTTEISTLELHLRDGWRPVMCMKGVENGSVYRIDERRNRQGAPEYRLLGYVEGADLRSIPFENLTGHAEIEGTAGTLIYHFTSPTGAKAVFEPEVPDGSLPQIDFTSPAGVRTAVPVVRAYWLDLLPNSN